MKESAVRRQLLPLALAVVLALTACSGSSSSAKPSQLTLYNDKGAWTPFFNQVGQLSQKDLGLGLKPVGYTDEPTYQATITASFRTNVKPDLFTWTTGGRLGEIVNAGAVADTSSLWQDGIKNGDLGAALQPYYTIGGKQYCVPLNISYWVMFYNKHVFDQYGLTPPTTWAGLVQLAAALKSHGVTPFYQTSVLFSFVWFEQLVAGTDPALYDDLSTGKASYTDPRVVAIMKQWKQLIDAGYMSDPGSKIDPAVQLKSGQVAMASFGTWFGTSMTQQQMKPGVDYGFFAIPNVNPGLSKTSMVFESGPLCVEKRAAHLDSSMQFLKWWLGTSAQTTWANSRGDVSANPKVKIPDAAVNTLNGDAGSGRYQLVNRYFEAAPPPVLNAALDAFGGFMVDTNSYPQALSTIQKAADDYWATHKK
jgi:ABC-type glycerol-3-phosphate transport system substrate-binding protein